MERKHEILDVASELLQVRSYTAFSYQDLSDRLGIRKASIHHHFPSKQDLLLALIERFAERQRSKFGEFDRDFDKPRERLDAYFSLMRTIAQSGNKICPAVSLESEYNVIPPPVRDRLHDIITVRRDWLAGVLAQGRADGAMVFEGSAEVRALMIMSAVRGALLIARAEGPRAFTEVIKQINSDLRPSQSPGRARALEPQLRGKT